MLLCCLFLFLDIVIQYPQFFGHSYVTFEPLKNSYQAFQITLEFRVRISCLMNANWTDILAGIGPYQLGCAGSAGSVEVYPKSKYDTESVLKHIHREARTMGTFIRSRVQ